MPGKLSPKIIANLGIGRNAMMQVSVPDRKMSKSIIAKPGKLSFAMTKTIMKTENER